MPSSAPHGSSSLHGLTLPVFISVALHALFAILFCILPTLRDDDNLKVVDTAIRDNENRITLSLASMPTATSGVNNRAGNSGANKNNQEQEFNVVVLPTPSLIEESSVAPPQVLLPSQPVSARQGSLPTGDGKEENGPGDNGGNKDSLGILRVAPPTRSVVYVIDCSMSMGGPDERSHKFALARRELFSSLRQLPEGTSFQVIAYNHQADTLLINGQSGLLSNNHQNIQAAMETLAKRKPSGWTDHAQALRRGLRLRADVLVFVTDGDDLKPAQERDATAFNKGRSVIHVVEISSRPCPNDCPLRALARANRGSYRHVALAR